MENILYRILNIAQTYPEFAREVTTVLRWVFVVLAAYILLLSIFSLLTTRCTPEIWGYFLVENGGNYPITHWENVIGRSRSADINIPVRTISGNHAILARRDDTKWILKSLSETSDTVVNGYKLIPGRRYLINTGDEIVAGGVHCTVAPASIDPSIAPDVTPSHLKKRPAAVQTAKTRMSFVQFVLSGMPGFRDSSIFSVPVPFFIRPVRNRYLNSGGQQVKIMRSLST